MSCPYTQITLCFDFISSPRPIFHNFRRNSPTAFRAERPHCLLVFEVKLSNNVISQAAFPFKLDLSLIRFASFSYLCQASSVHSRVTQYFSLNCRSCLYPQIKEETLFVCGWSLFTRIRVVHNSAHRGGCKYKPNIFVEM